MRGNGGADARAVAIDHVEHAGRHASGVHDLGEDLRREGRDFGGLQHHGAAHGESRRDLAGDLVERPVPRRDEATNADRLFHDQRRAALRLLELVGLQHVERGAEMRRAHGRLRTLRQPHGGAHFFRDGLGHVLVAVLQLRHDAHEQVHALLARGLGPGLERLAGGLHGAVHILGAAERNAAGDGFGGGIDDVERLGRNRVDPFAIDVELQIVAHISLPLFRARPPAGVGRHNSV